MPTGMSGGQGVHGIGGVQSLAMLKNRVPWQMVKKCQHLPENGGKGVVLGHFQIPLHKTCTRHAQAKAPREAKEGRVEEHGLFMRLGWLWWALPGFLQRPPVQQHRQEQQRYQEAVRQAQHQEKTEPRVGGHLREH